MSARREPLDPAYGTMMRPRCRVNEWGWLIHFAFPVTCRCNAGSLRPSDFLSACLDHGPLQRALQLLHAAGIAGVVAPPRNLDVRRNAAAHAYCGRARRLEGADHWWRTVNASRRSRFR